MKDIVLISRAWNFAAQRHASQRRKGKAQKPYVNHLAEVAELVATATDGQDANVVAAAVLHDTVEDTATLPAELTAVFNADIAGLVAEVTDDKSLEKAVRKKLQVEHAAASSRRAKLIKLADKTSNFARPGKKSTGRLEFATATRVSGLGHGCCKGVARNQPMARSAI